MTSIGNMYNRYNKSNIGKSINKIDNKIQNKTGYSTKHIIIGFITICVLAWVIFALYNKYFSNGRQI